MCRCVTSYCSLHVCHFLSTQTNKQTGNKQTQSVMRCCLTVVALVAPRLQGPEQRDDAQALPASRRLSAALCLHLLAVNLELCAGFEGAHVPAMDPALYQHALRLSVHRETHQGQVTVRLVAARRLAPLRVFRLRDQVHVRQSGLPGDQVQALILLNGLVPLAVQSQTGTDQETDRQ